ncbi:MAG: 30S ribosomal protein S17 [Deltaproteobacteria bacterium]|nr:30S ribosomal protein S17 [Deltaproteobacteria bacterium]
MNEKRVLHPTEKKSFIGVVISNKMTKTVVVEVRSRVKDPVFEKYLTQREKFYAHDEKGECQRGDKVRIVPTRPLSKMKRWAVEQVLEKSEGIEGDILEAKV